MRLTFIAQNLKFGGLWDDDGTPQNRWPQLRARLQSAKEPADFILLNEARDWEKQGHGPLARAMHDLDMDALPLAPSKTGQHVGLLYRKESVGRWKHWNTAYVQEVTQSFGVAAFDIGLDAPLSVVPVHLTPFGNGKALQETFLVASRGYRHGPYVVIGGDINYPPAHGPEPDYAAMRPWNTASTTVLNQNGELKADRRVGLAFEKAGYADVAWLMHQKTGDEKYLQRTANFERVDQFWVSQPLVNAVIDYWLITEPSGASDHAGIAFILDTDLVERGDNRQYG
jgi:endonuclease/exonuclease/phosphatase family metal-dependent hydrolase